MVPPQFENSRQVRNDKWKSLSILHEPLMVNSPAMANDFGQIIFWPASWVVSFLTGSKGWSGFSPRSTMTISDAGKFHCYDPVAGPPRLSLRKDTRRWFSTQVERSFYILDFSSRYRWLRHLRSWMWFDRETSNGPPTRHGLFSTSLSPHV